MEYRDSTFYVGRVPLPEIAERWGTPFYVYDGDVIVRQAERVKRAFAGLPFRPFYAMKANSNLALLRLIHDHGFGCDAVSPGEIFLARRAGFAPAEIWFTCSNVSDDDLRAIPDPRVVINVNSMSEVNRCVGLDLENPIALRINPDVGAGHHHDVVTAGGGVKFGIDLSEIEPARRAIEDSGRKVVGIHAHIGSGIDSIDPLLESARRLLEVSAAFPNMKWINFGGGIGVPYRPDESEFPIEDYGRAMTALAGDFLRARGLTAILEPGRFIAAQSGILVARVTTRRISAGMDWIGCDTGFNHLVRPSKYGAYHHIVNLTSGTAASLRESWSAEAMAEALVVSGNLCESGDVFTRDPDGTPVPRPMDCTRIGDLIAFCDAGAYGFSMASHYNARLLPPEVLVRGGEATLVRRRQTMEELTGGML